MSARTYPLNGASCRVGKGRAGGVDAVALLDLLVKGSPIVLAVVLVGFMFGWIVPGTTHKDVKAQRDRLLEIVLTAVQGLKETTPTVIDTNRIVRGLEAGINELKRRKPPGGTPGGRGG